MKWVYPHYIPNVTLVQYGHRKKELVGRKHIDMVLWISKEVLVYLFRIHIH